MLQSSILILDPDPTVRHTLAAALTARANTVVTTTTVPAALRAICAFGNTISLLIIALDLPDATASVLITVTRQQHPTCPCLALVPADYAPATVRAALDTKGINDYVWKPIQPAEIVARVQQLHGNAYPHMPGIGRRRPTNRVPQRDATGEENHDIQ